MCQCTPTIKTPFCGKLGCEWPKQEGVKSTNKTNKLIEEALDNIFDFVDGNFPDKVTAQFMDDLAATFIVIARAARDEERERIKEKYGHFKYKCCVHSWDGCLRLQKELDYEKCFK